MSASGKSILPSLIVLISVVGGFVGVAAYQEWRSSRRAESERLAMGAIFSLRTAAQDFALNDRDGNGVKDYWTGDVKGLYHLKDARSGEPIRLILPELAAADPSHPGARPYHGYWFIAMDLDVDGKPFRLDTPGGKSRHPSRFGFCAYPAGSGHGGRSRFIINEENGVLKNWDIEPLRRWPTDAELRTRWSKPS